MSLLGIDVRPSLTYLLEPDDWHRTVVLGGLSLLLGAFLLPLFLVAGYHVRVLRTTVAGDDSPPAFGAWRDLAADGLRASTVVFAYLLALFFVSLGFLFVAGIVGADASATDPAVSTRDAAVLALVGLNALVGLLVLYVVPAAIAATAEQTSVRAGLALRELRPVVTSRGYLQAWLAADVALVGTVAAASAIGAVPLLGALAAPFAIFYGTTVAWRLFGRGLRELRDAGDAPGARRPDRPPSLSDNLRGRVSNVVGDTAGAVRTLLPIDAAGAVGPGDTSAGRATDGDGGDAAVGYRWDAATVETLADRPPAALDGEDVATLVAALDADDPETVATAARTLGDVAAARPGLIEDAGVRPRLRDLRLADDERVREAATRAVRRLSDAGLY